MVGRLQSRRATYCFGKWGQLGEGVVCVWSDLRHLAGHTKVVVSVAFSPDGQHIVSGSDDRFRVKLWSVSGSKKVASLAGHMNATHLFGRLQSRWATYRFWRWRQIGEGGCVAVSVLLS